MGFLRKLFNRKPKPAVQETSSSFQIVQDGVVTESIRKDAIQSAQIAINVVGVGSGGLVFYLNSTGGKQLVIPYYFKGTPAVEKYIFALPGVNKNRLIAMAESGESVTLDVWRRSD